MAKKLVLIILAVVLLYIGLTAYQILSIVKLMKDGGFGERLKNAIEDCTDYEAVIKEVDTGIKKIKFSCINPFIAFLSSKSESDLCSDIKDTKETYDILEKIKSSCEAAQA